MDIGAPELIIIAVIVLLLFGPGKAADLGSSLGKGIREFRHSIKDEDQTAPVASSSLPQSSPSIAATAASADGTRHCTTCNVALQTAQRYCGACGAAVAQPPLVTDVAHSG